jgi:hypothetical protein
MRNRQVQGFTEPAKDNLKSRFFTPFFGKCWEEKDESKTNGAPPNRGPQRRHAEPPSKTASRRSTLEPTPSAVAQSILSDSSASNDFALLESMI